MRDAIDKLYAELFYFVMNIFYPNIAQIGETNEYNLKRIQLRCETCCHTVQWIPVWSTEYPDIYQRKHLSVIWKTDFEPIWEIKNFTPDLFTNNFKK